MHDHEGIVWDEMVGMWITLWLVPEGWYWLLLGFLVFQGVRHSQTLADPLDRPACIWWGIGIMLDDILAGVFAWLSHAVAGVGVHLTREAVACVPGCWGCC